MPLAYSSLPCSPRPRSGVNILPWLPKLFPDIFFKPESSSLHLESLKRVLFGSLLLPPRRHSPTKGFLSWLGALRWHEQFRRHLRKLLRTWSLSGNSHFYRWQSVICSECRLGFSLAFLLVFSSDDEEMAHVNKGCPVSLKSPSFPRVSQEAGARELTRVDSMKFL